MDRPLASMRDAELACRVADGCERAFEELARRYRWLWSGVAVSRWFPGAAREDVTQEALIALHHAAYSYDPGSGTFHTFAQLVVRRRVTSALGAATTGRSRVLSEAARFGHPFGGEELPLDDVVATREPGPHAIVEAREALAMLLRISTTALERLVLYGRLVGLEYEEIAVLADDRDRKSIDNALQRVKSKAVGVTG